MVVTAPPLRHGGAGRFDRAMRRAVAFAKRDGTIACVELHDFASKQTVKFRFHERATNKAKPRRSLSDNAIDYYKSIYMYIFICLFLCYLHICIYMYIYLIGIYIYTYM